MKLREIALPIHGCLLLLVVLLVVAMFPSTSHGDDRSRFFNGSAAEKADQRYRRSMGGNNESTFGGSVTSRAAELDTVRDILDDRGQSDFFVQYRGPFYMAYVYDIVPLPYDQDDDRAEALAQRALVYQAASSISKVIIGSALEPLYRQALEAVRALRDYTSLKVRRQETGGFSVGEKSKEKPLIEFKLHVSANNGIEPRVQFGDNCTLRYDVIHQDTLLEFRKDF